MRAPLMLVLAGVVTGVFTHSHIAVTLNSEVAQHVAEVILAADAALYAMTLTVLGSVLLHGGGSVVIARSLTGPPPSAGGGPGSPGTDEPHPSGVAMQS
ncbi:hypothetical protein ABZ499_09555 [Streptomyces sp. NPDC019990]|uniref:hypothetical protein n=1 Tax=Streptomyces sp. NPDC019990 TaxID=3154693 RepID=UPI0033C99330